jgi:hypothetical protein
MRSTASFRGLRDERYEGCSERCSPLEHIRRLVGGRFQRENGWAVEHDPSSASPDGSDAEKIYRILEDEIIPLYYKTLKAAFRKIGSSR